MFVLWNRSLRCSWGKFKSSRQVHEHLRSVFALPNRQIQFGKRKATIVKYRPDKSIESTIRFSW